MTTPLASGRADAYRRGDVATGGTTRHGPRCRVVHAVKNGDLVLWCCGALAPPCGPFGLLLLLREEVGVVGQVLAHRRPGSRRVTRHERLVDLRVVTGGLAQRGRRLVGDAPAGRAE